MGVATIRQSTASRSTPAGSFWADAENKVELAYQEIEDDEIIFAETVILDSEAKMAAVVCKRLVLGHKAKVKVAYVTKSVELSSRAQIEHLFRRQGATLELGYQAKAPRTPLIPSGQWQAEANEFMGR